MTFARRTAAPASLALAGIGLAAGAVAAFSAASSTGCSLVENVSADQCATAADCTRIGLTGASCENHVCTNAQSDGGAPWSCLGHVPNLQNISATPVTLTFPFDDLVSGNPIAGVTVQACAKLDLDCSSPLTSVITSNGEGVVNVPLMAGFDGYLKTTWSEAPETLCFINPPVTDSTPRDDTDLVSTAFFHTIAAYSIDGGAGDGGAIDPNAGTIFSNVGDCNGNNGEGVSVTIDDMGPKTKLVYQINGLPTESATQTDSSGNFVVINVPAGNVTLTATLVATGQRIGVATGFARAGEFSYVFVVPSP